MSKNLLLITIIYVLGIGLTSCNKSNEEEILENIIQEYKNEYGKKLEISLEEKKIKNRKVIRLSGWSKSSISINSENPVEWIIIFSDDQHKLIKGTGFMPLDSIPELNNLNEEKVEN